MELTDRIKSSIQYETDSDSYQSWTDTVRSHKHDSNSSFDLGDRLANDQILHIGHGPPVQLWFRSVEMTVSKFRCLSDIL